MAGVIELHEAHVEEALPWFTATEQEKKFQLRAQVPFLKGILMDVSIF